MELGAQPRANKKPINGAAKGMRGDIGRNNIGSASPPRKMLTEFLIEVSSKDPRNSTNCRKDLLSFTLKLRLEFLCLGA